MKYLVIVLCRWLYWIGKLVGKESCFAGKVAIRFCPTILKELKLPDNWMIVTGSNGKTATVTMITKVLSNAGFSVASNCSNEDSLEGMITAILKYTSITGVIQKDVFVVSCEGRVLPDVLKWIKPKYMVVTNLYRDKMSINGHPELVYDEMQKEITQDIHLILNTDDPLSSLFGYKRENVTYFGINKNELSQKKNESCYDDGKYCPNCKGILKYRYYHLSHLGSYSCEKCGHSRKEPRYAVTHFEEKTGEIVVNKKYHIPMALHSIYDAYPILATFAVARLFGVEEKKIVSTLTNDATRKDNTISLEWNGHHGQLWIAKQENPISYNQCLLEIVHQEEECTVVIWLEEMNPPFFTSETSWIWDIDFEALAAECVKKIILVGKYANDLAVRFENSSLGMEKVIVAIHEEEIQKEVSENAIGNVKVITNFSDRMKLRKRR